MLKLLGGDALSKCLQFVFMTLELHLRWLPSLCRTQMGGSQSAHRSAEQGAQSIMDTLQEASGERPNGGFFRDGQPLPW